MRKYYMFMVVIFTMLFLCACGSEKSEYNITYELYGGDGVATQETIKNDIDYALPNANKAGYKFYGWYDNSGFTGEPITSIKAGSTSDIKLYAKFSKIFTVTYVADGGSHTTVSFFTVEDKLILEPATKNGYVFLGWYETSSREGEKIEILNQMHDVTLYAKYGIAYSIIYELNGGVNNENNPEEFCAEQRISLKAPTQNGKTFLGWYGSDNRKVTAIPVGTTEDVYLYAKWENATYNLTWDLAGGRSTATYPTKYTFGEGVSEDKFVYPTKDNMVFAGWYIEKDDTSEYVKNISDKEYGDLTIRAKWANAEVINLGERWVDSKTVGMNESSSRDTSALTVTIPEELKNIFNEGRLGLEVVGTFYANVRSQGNCTANATAYMVVAGSEYYVCSSSAKGGGYPILVSQVPNDGPWGYSGNQTKSVKTTLTSAEIQIGYLYVMTSDRSNNYVKISTQCGCVQLICRFYVI